MDIQDLMPKIVERMQTTGQQRPAIYADSHCLMVGLAICNIYFENKAPDAD